MNLELLNYMRYAFFGNIPLAVRGVAVGHDSCSKILVLRYYLDREPNEDDFESLEVVATNISSMCPKNIVSDYELECFKDTRPSKDLDPLDGFFYFRKE